MERDGSGYLTTSGAARALGLSESAVRLLARRGDLSCTRIAGGLRVFARAEVDALAAWRRDNPRRHKGTAAAKRTQTAAPAGAAADRAPESPA